jgi:hypothetical protein
MQKGTAGKNHCVMAAFSEKIADTILRMIKN